MNTTSDAAPSSLTDILQMARKEQRISQLELSLRMGVSQRHISFVESGRSRPSRELLISWLGELQTPLALRNAALHDAGYAEAYSRAELNDAVHEPALAAMRQLLKAHEPMPALVMDLAWNVLDLNQGALWIAQVLMPEWMGQALQRPAGTRLNLLEALCHPKGMLSKMSNMHEVAPGLLAHLREDAKVLPALNPRIEEFIALVKTRLGLKHLPDWPLHLPPMLTSRYDTEYGELAVFSLFSTFGTPQSIQLASLRIEHICPANEHTAKVFRERGK